MRKISVVVQAFTLFLLTLLTSCEAIAGIFKAGVNVGIFIVIGIIVLIIAIVLGLFNRKS